jgi:hypothetical protein
MRPRTFGGFHFSAEKPNFLQRLSLPSENEFFRRVFTFPSETNFLTRTCDDRESVIVAIACGLATRDVFVRMR